MHLLGRFNTKLSQRLLSGNGAWTCAIIEPATSASSKSCRGWLSSHNNYLTTPIASYNTTFYQCNPRYSSSSSSSSIDSNHAFIQTPQDEQVIRDLFLSFATQQDDDKEAPSLRVDDLRDLLHAIGDCPTDSKLSRLIEVVDADGNGTIEYDEFVAGCGAILDFTKEDTALDVDTLIDTFHTLDADGSGDLTMDELSRVLSTTGVSLSEDDARDIMNAADVNNDGKISLEEFLMLMTDRSKTKYSWRIRSGFRACLVLGGPGSGKGTLCDKLVEHANLRHCSSGEMLRDEIASGSALAKSIEKTMKEGKLVSSSTIIALLKKQLLQFPGQLVALDGFPRNRQNYLDFDKVMGSPEFAIFVDVPDDEMISRILKRAETSGRADDNLETAKLRLKTFHNETKPTLEHLKLSNVPIYRLDGTNSQDEVWEELLEKCPLISSRRGLKGLE